MSLNVRRTNEEKTLNRDVSEHFNKNQAYIKSIYALKRNKLTNNVVKIVNTHIHKKYHDETRDRGETKKKGIESLLAKACENADNCEKKRPIQY